MSQKLSEYIEALDGITYPQWVKLRTGIDMQFDFSRRELEKICRSLPEKQHDLSVWILEMQALGDADVRHSSSNYCTWNECTFRIVLFKRKETYRPYFKGTGRWHFFNICLYSMKIVFDRSSKISSIFLSTFFIWIFWIAIFSFRQV